MKISLIILGLLILSGDFTVSAPSSQISRSNLRIWYDHPAKSVQADENNGWNNDAEWLKAFPIGNGFMGAMVFGDVNRERIQLNEKSLWSGSPEDGNNPNAFASLNQIRQLLWQGKYREAEALTEKTQICQGKGSGQGNGANVPYGTFQTLGDWWFDFGKTTLFSHYYRELDLSRGVVRISYQQEGIGYERELFVSYPDRALVMHLTANRKGSISFSTSLTRPERYETTALEDQLLMSGYLTNGVGGNGMHYAVRLKANVIGGKVVANGNKLMVNKADEVTLILTAATDYRLDYPHYKGEEPQITTAKTLEKANGQKYSHLLEHHVKDYLSLFGKVQLQLSSLKADTIPTDRRLLNQGINPDDLHLQELYFQFGRYLLIASSREGTLPANLQGIWSNKIQTPWNGDYHTDINVQMNYWPADVTNLSECYSPLVQLIASLVEPGRKTAAVQYHAKGWCVHPITNVWGFTAPGEHPGWGMHLGAGGWLCQHLWDHYTFTMDQTYLRQVYPILLESALFYLDWLVADPVTGKLVSGPAASPENAFVAPDGSTGSMSMGPSHDQEIIHELFTNLLKAADVLQLQEPIRPRIEKALQQLAMPGIGSDGRLMEWSKEFPEREPTHRHVSHLYLLYPGSGLDIRSDKATAEAIRKSLQVRGDGGTGWSLAWKISFWARLAEGNHAYLMLKNLLRPSGNFGTDFNGGGTFFNLFCAHPPFQIDGNFGATAGIAEMLMQSHTGCIDLLPALPDAWKDGLVKGLVARGNFEVSIAWNNHQLQTAEVLANHGGRCVVRSAVPLRMKGEKMVSSASEGGYLLSFQSVKGRKYLLEKVQ